MGITMGMMRICILICICILIGQCIPTDGIIRLHVVLVMEGLEDGVRVLEGVGLGLVEVLRRLLVGLVLVVGVLEDVLLLLEGIVVVEGAEGEAVEEEEEDVVVVEVEEAAAEEVDEYGIIWHYLVYGVSLVSFAYVPECMYGYG
jgi:hypothetical protein